MMEVVLLIFEKAQLIRVTKWERISEDCWLQSRVGAWSRPWISLNGRDLDSGNLLQHLNWPWFWRFVEAAHWDSTPCWLKRVSQAQWWGCRLPGECHTGICTPHARGDVGLEAYDEGFLVEKLTHLGFGDFPKFLHLAIILDFQRHFGSLCHDDPEA